MTKFDFLFKNSSSDGVLVYCSCTSISTVPVHVTEGLKLEDFLSDLDHVTRRVSYKVEQGLCLFLNFMTPTKTKNNTILVHFLQQHFLNVNLYLHREKDFLQ
jgi:hypothetical protein